MLKILVREGDHGLGKVSLATISGLDFEQGPVGDGFPCGSVDKESACNAGDTFHPWVRRSPGEGHGNSEATEVAENMHSVEGKGMSYASLWEKASFLDRGDSQCQGLKKKKYSLFEKQQRGQCRYS